MSQAEPTSSFATRCWSRNLTETNAIVDDIDEALLLLQVRQELQGADQVIAHSHGWCARFEHSNLFHPATHLDRKYPVCLPPCVAHHTQHTTNSTAPLRALQFFSFRPSAARMTIFESTRVQCTHSQRRRSLLPCECASRGRARDVEVISKTRGRLE